ncbi:hypothetical protein [Mesorhizobium sp.]|uniref:hypothetical protein n=1 Tax=Mesorhizobium sp. TaxID=1871066 RepID=UPI0025C4503F|nr:hypothetical protein [Mesorhizobium sp.]
MAAIIEESDHVAAGLPGIESGIERLPCPGIGVGGEQGIAVDQIAQGLWLALQVADEVPEIDIVSSLRMFDADPVGGHHLVRPEKELNPVIIEVGMEAVAMRREGTE